MLDLSTVVKKAFNPLYSGEFTLFWHKLLYVAKYRNTRFVCYFWAKIFNCAIFHAYSFSETKIIIPHPPSDFCTYACGLRSRSGNVIEGLKCNWQTAAHGLSHPIHTTQSPSASADFETVDFSISGTLIAVVLKCKVTAWPMALPLPLLLHRTRYAVKSAFALVALTHLPPSALSSAESITILVDGTD